jgi:hypothetical protein
MSIFSDFCSENKKECSNGIERLMQFVEAFKIKYNTLILPQLQNLAKESSSQYDKYEFAIDELIAIGKQMYGKSSKEAELIMTKWISDNAQNGKDIIFMSYGGELDEVLKYFGFNDTGLYTNFNYDTTNIKFEDVNPIDQVNANYVKHPTNSYSANSYDSALNKSSNFSAFYQLREIPFMIVMLTNAESGTGLSSVANVKYQWELFIPVIFSKKTVAGGGSGGGTAIPDAIEDDCPCQEYTRDINLYLRRTQGSGNDTPINVAFKKQVCKEIESEKKAKINCESEVAKIKSTWGR